MKTNPKSKVQKITLAAGTILGVLLIVALASATIQKYSYVQIVLLIAFAAIAVQDARFGKMNIFVLALPVAVVAFFYLDIFLQLFLWPFVVLAGIWALAFFMTRKYPKFREILTYGFGDVVALPLAITLAMIFSRIPGLMIFGVATMAVMLYGVLVKKKFLIRLVPWMLPGVLAAWLLGLIL